MLETAPYPLLSINLKASNKFKSGLKDKFYLAFSIFFSDSTISINNSKSSLKFYLFVENIYFLFILYLFN